MSKKKRRKKKKLLPNLLDFNEEPADVEKMSTVVSSPGHDVSIGSVSIVMSKDIYQKLMYYVMATTDEISGLGICAWDNESIRVEEIFLLKQENTSASTELDDEEVSKLMNQLIRNGKDVSGLRFWWHKEAA
ncbi:MAG: hypothetical protein ACTSRU_17550 [Candidatus Hodarchaeales archaeon]